MFVSDWLVKWDLQLDDILLLYACAFFFYIIFLVISMEYFLLLGSHDNLLGVLVDGGLFNRIFSAFGAAVLPPRSCSPCYILGKYSLEYRVFIRIRRRSLVKKLGQKDTSLFLFVGTLGFGCNMTGSIVDADV
ncbi:hypothetical protein CUMW_057310 [Citrus unshiu]|nr:hypothetical protein CUMW_057310 [Citrus unshiu]